MWSVYLSEESLSTRLLLITGQRRQISSASIIDAWGNCMQCQDLNAPYCEAVCIDIIIIRISAYLSEVARESAGERDGSLFFLKIFD